MHNAQSKGLGFHVIFAVLIEEVSIFWSSKQSARRDVH